VTGLKSKTPYKDLPIYKYFKENDDSDLKIKSSKTYFDNPYLTLYGIFCNWFRLECTDVLGKREGTFLSTSNKQHVINFRQIINFEN
jgi:hypothetical protein